MSDQLAIGLYQAVAADNEPRVYKHWHASNLGDCPRAHYFKRLGLPPRTVPGAGKMIRWRAGHILEEVIRPYLTSLYPDMKSNVRLTSKQLDLTGEYDNYSEKSKTIFEVKSVGVRAPRYKKAGEDRYHLREDGPYLGHEYQNHGYVLLLREKGLCVDYIHYVYITLEGLILTYLTQVDPKILSNVEKRLEILKNSNKEIPPCLCRPEHPLWGSNMQFCDYKDEEGECCSLDYLNKWRKENESIT